ncbi:MAG TPA: hypothetical protein VGR93_09155 [Candidatus Acidoferrales bacterium]|nr:hypothetical protein [Candidatus Acidoferrales bacterium]
MTMRLRTCFARYAVCAGLGGSDGHGAWMQINTKQHNFYRFDYSFIDHSVSEEMEVSEFLNRTASPSAVLYTNMNYPDFAYYRCFKVDSLPENRQDLYASLKNLPNDNILIAYRQDDPDAPAEPAPHWLNSNPHFHRLREFPSLVLYQYRANVTR